MMSVTEETEQSQGSRVLCVLARRDNSRVLIVDDHQAILELFRVVLSSSLPDIRIDLAENGEEALDTFRSGHHAVVLMDLHMPLMDGHRAFDEMMNWCEARGWETPSVVFCTGFAPPERLKEMLSGTSSHCLLFKPVTNEVLVEAVRSRLA